MYKVLIHQTLSTDAGEDGKEKVVEFTKQFELPFVPCVGHEIMDAAFNTGPFEHVSYSPIGDYFRCHAKVKRPTNWLSMTFEKYSEEFLEQGWERSKRVWDID